MRGTNAQSRAGSVEPMNSAVAVVGPGAVGTTIAGYLHAAGYAPLLCGRTPREDVQVRPDGATPIVVPGPVRTDPAAVPGPVSLVLLAVKTTQIEAAAGWLDALCDERTRVCVLQNGVEQVQRVAPHCRGATVFPGIVWFGAETQPGGWVRLRTEPRLTLPAGAESVAAGLREAGCHVDVDADITTALWRKLVVNAVAGLMVLTRRRSGMFRRDDLAALALGYAREAVAVGRAEGAVLDEGLAEQTVRRFADGPPDMGTSILSDATAHRPLEWEVRNAVITRRGRRHALATPIADVVTVLLAAASDGPG